jgi:putative ABC transport system permease protein
MIKNYFKTAWRNLLKDRKFALLNILGLATALACVLLISLWVNEELSFDKFFPHDSQIYQLMVSGTADGDTQISPESSGLLAKAVKQQMPEVEYAASLAPPGWFPQYTLSVKDKNIRASGQYAGKDYFNIFSFKLLDGDRDNLLSNNNSIVISDNLARKLFGTTKHLLGKAITFEHDTTFYVSGVFQHPPVNSSQQFDFVLPFSYLRTVQDWVNKWNDIGPHNFVLLRKGTDINAFNKKIAGIITANTGDTTSKAVAVKFSNVYLQNSFSSNSKGESRIEYVKLFSLISVFILVIACINFMNLSTAKAYNRLKEVSVRKVAGAARGQLIFQFLAESMLLTLLAAMLAIVIAWLLLPPFNQIAGEQIHLHLGAGIILFFIGVALLTGLLAGSYPAFYLSGLKISVLSKKKLIPSIAENISRKGLVIFQFVISTVLIIAVISIYRQVQYIQNLNPGYNKNNVLGFDAEGNLQQHEMAFVSALRQLPGVVNASYTSNNMVGHTYGDYGISWPGEDPNENVYFEGYRVGYDFIETMGMHMSEGRSFSPAYGDDSSKIILNETAVKLMHLKDPVGKMIQHYGKNYQVIGVVKDFHYESLYKKITPLYMVWQPAGSKIMVSIRPQNQQATIASIHQLYTEYSPGFPFTFTFLDEAYQQQYENVDRMSELSRYFAGLAILISCLGLFGLTAFIAEKRQKEIGIRKVLGAGTQSVVMLLSKNFIQLIVLAMLIATPVAWYCINRWLQNFAYRTHISWWIFLMAGLISVAIALLTVSFQAIKAALANPVKSLRTE